jgi:hypothetical protein
MTKPIPSFEFTNWVIRKLAAFVIGQQPQECRKNAAYNVAVNPARELSG